MVSIPVLSPPIARYINYCRKNPDTYPAQTFNILSPILKNLPFPPDKGHTNLDFINIFYYHHFSDNPSTLSIYFAKYVNGNDIHIIYKNPVKDISKEIYLSFSDPQWAINLNRIIINFQYKFLED